MLSYIGFLLSKFRWAKGGVWGHVGNVALIVGFVLAILAWAFPAWAKQHVSERMSAFALGVIPLLFGASVFLFRWVFLSGYFVYHQQKVEKVELTKALDKERDTKSAKERVSKHIKAMSDLWAEGKRVLENLLNPDRDLNLVKAEESDCYRNEASDWYGRVVKYLQANGEPDDVNYFEHCDDGADQIPNPFESVLEKRNALCRGIKQRNRNLRVIIERTKQP